MSTWDDAVGPRGHGRLRLQPLSNKAKAMGINGKLYILLSKTPVRMEGTMCNNITNKNVRIREREYAILD